jgi:SAM-dependent MidA family methyltransferase
LFGELVARQIVEMAGILHSEFGIQDWELVEAGAGNGRLSADILRTIKRDAADTYQHARLHLVETSDRARATHNTILDDVADRLVASSRVIPDSFEGILIANELLDAMPVHQVVMRDDGLREIYVESVGGTLKTAEGPLSTPRLEQYFAALAIALEPGWRAEVSLAAIDWVGDSMRRMTRGFAIFIDYGHEARELYSVTHSAGTLTSFARHRSAGPEAASPGASWLRDAGHQDLTAHVDFTSIRRALEAAGCATLGFLDQMYFLMALGEDRFATLDLKQRLALKTLVMPGGLGSTMKVLIVGKAVGSPRLTGCSSRMRVT